MPFASLALAIGLFAFAVVETVSAQAHFGLRAGPTIGYLGGDFIEDGGGGEWGVEIGLEADVHLFANVELVTGLAVLHQKGGRNVKAVSSDSLWGYKFGYMRVPFMLRPMFKLGDSAWSIGPFAGVYVGFNGTCKVKRASVNGFETDCNEDTVGGEGAGTDYGIPIGIDAIADFAGGSRWELTARLDLGLANVLDGADAQGFSAVQRLIVLGFGFSYPLF